uniref:Uncharacterized protein n=1 Tax=Peronospora matthiolae TaxID=2874970 RepID=A0AAV1UUP4_9STRA
MKFWNCRAMALMILLVASPDAVVAEKETGVTARHMLAMGDESAMFARGLLRRGTESN